MRSMRRSLVLLGFLFLSLPGPVLAQEAATEHAPLGMTERGEHEEGPVIENWFSFDYGPGKTHRSPPFGFAIFNFVVFLAILYRFGGKAFREFMLRRHNEVRHALDEARKLQERAREELARYQERIQNIDAEVEAMLQTVRKEAEAERARIMAAAEAQAEQMKRDAEAQIEQEVLRARHELRAATVQAALQAAETILRAQVQVADQQRLLDAFVRSVESLAPSSQTPTRRGGQA